MRPLLRSVFHKGMLALSGGTLLALTACAGQTNPGQDPRGLWVGALVTDKGVCPTDRNSTLQVNAHEILFTPADGSLVLRGVRGPNNLHFHAQLETTDQDHKPRPMVFDGYPVGQAIGGTFGTPSCRAHVTMTRS
ncbi:hypothetical protein [Brytella acorum]|uniref:Lipoprotein n=1 Tax=Brytella acorum TaxID=2959299 RepID=A0AA35XVG9_9PROT|nr:hypothetical protein [Brytella acorum]MDF3624419.1 hypothetical protein [Brytella acorum]CAI9119731.1 hypothetical protein LMG32879_000553 [Brytella acorum]